MTTTRHRPRNDKPPKTRLCQKCAVRFEPPESSPWTKVCDGCRPKVIPGVTLPPPGHTHEWDKRSLGIMEASILRRAWGAKRSNSVTEN